MYDNIYAVYSICSSLLSVVLCCNIDETTTAAATASLVLRIRHN